MLGVFETVPIEYEAWWVPQPLGPFFRREKPLASYWDSKPVSFRQ
jgi:hypothetical protein